MGSLIEDISRRTFYDRTMNGLATLRWSVRGFAVGLGVIGSLHMSYTIAKVRFRTIREVEVELVGCFGSENKSCRVEGE